MTMRNTFLKSCIGICLMALVLGLFPARASAAVTNKYEAILIWGSDDEKTPENHKPVSPEVAKKLKNFKWKNYFEVARKDFTVVKDDKGSKAGKDGKDGKETRDKDQTKVKMSKDCEIILKLLDNDQVEVTLIGKGKTASTIKQQLRKGGCLVTGGDASNSTGWFIIIKQVE